MLIRKKFFSIERIKDLLDMAKKENQPLLQLLVDKKLTTLTTSEKLMGSPIYEISSVLNEHVSDVLGLEQEDVAAIFIEMKELAKNIA